MGHHGGSSKPATTYTKTESTTSNPIWNQIGNTVQEAVNNAQMPPDLKYVGLNADELAALQGLQGGRDLAAAKTIQDFLSGNYQENIQQGQSLNQQGQQLGQKAQEALGYVAPLLGKGEEATQKGQEFVGNAAEGFQNLSNMTPEQLNQLIGSFYNSDLVKQQIAQQRGETNDQIAQFVHGLNSQYIASGGMASSRAGVAQGVGTAKIESEFQKNLIGFQTAQQTNAQNVAQNFLTNKLNAYNGMNQSGNSLINAGQSWGNFASQYGQLGQSYSNLQQNYFNQGNFYTNLGNTQANQVFQNNLSLEDARIKDLSNKFAAGQIIQQNAQAQANVDYQNQQLHLNPALSRLNTLVPMLNAVNQYVPVTTTQYGTTQSTPFQSGNGGVGSLVGGVGGAILGGYLGQNYGGAVGMTGTQGQQLGTNTGAYLGSMFS